MLYTPFLGSSFFSPITPVAFAKYFFEVYLFIYYSNAGLCGLAGVPGYQGCLTRIKNSLSR